mmetsp:Transcript_28078/g.74086  ORF Transcript_28078/g.74086 Transcript_28078/m.74086 type:complete len:125 (+) Transcript_28078:826-1200(+)
MKIEHPLLPLPRLPDQLTYSPFPIVLPHRFPSPFHLTPPPPCPRVGRKLGLNYDFKCDTTPIAPDGGFHLSQGPFRSAPVWPNYLIDLVRARAHLPPFPCDMGEGPYPPQTNFVRAAGPTAHWR